MAQLNSTNVVGNLSVTGQLAAAGNLLTGGQITANNILLTSTVNGSQTAASSPALRIGGDNSAIHLIIDRDAIGAKSNATTAGTLNLNESGGLVQIGSGGLKTGGRIYATYSSNSGASHLGILDAENTIADPGNNFFSGITMMSPNLTRADTTHIFLFGKTRASKNSGYIGYRWKSNGSNDNLVTIGHYGVDNVLNITGAGNVGIGTLAPTSKLHVNGTFTAGNSTLGTLSAGNTTLGTLSANATTISGTLTASGNAVVGPNLTIYNSSGGDVTLTFDRSSNASWKMVSSNGTLYTQCNYTSSKGSYYNVMSLEYNTKKATFTGEVNVKALQIDSAAKFVYNSTDKCIDVTFS